MTTEASAGEIARELVEDACRAMYGSNWDGPPDRAPNEAMKEVWRNLARKALKPAADLLAKVTAERDAAREALKPFAEVSDRLESQSVVSLREGAPITIHNPNCSPLPPLDFSKFRRARAVLEPKP